MHINEITRLIKEAGEKNNYPEIMDWVDIRWSNRMTSAMGSAQKQYGRYVISLSTKLFARATEEEKIQVVVHEACHVIAGLITGRRMKHDHEWRQTMRNAGFSPDVYHSVSCTGLRKKVKRYVWECPNGCNTFKVSTRTHNNLMKRGGRCPSCKATIDFTGRDYILER